MPTEYSPAGKGEWESVEHMMIATKPDHVLTSFVFGSEETARRYLGAANRYDAPLNVKEHFYSEIKRLQADE